MKEYNNNITFLFFFFLKPLVSFRGFFLLTQAREHRCDLVTSHSILNSPSSSSNINFIAHTRHHKNTYSSHLHIYFVAYFFIFFQFAFFMFFPPFHFTSIFALAVCTSVLRSVLSLLDKHAFFPGLGVCRELALHLQQFGNQ